MEHLLHVDSRILAFAEQRVHGSLNSSNIRNDDPSGDVEEVRDVTSEQEDALRWSGRSEKRTGSNDKRAKSFSKSAADYYVQSLPGLPNLSSHPTHPLNLYSGNIPSYPGEGNGGGEGDTGKDADIFFMMVKARRSAGNQKLIFWFNGGPGCSSFDGALMEVGPFRTVPASETKSGEVELKLVEGGWEEFATMVFIDQPPGTGLSVIPTNGYLHELSEASAHFVKFLEGFYEIFPEMQYTDTYLAGESFAGQYIPYFADAILNTKLLRNKVPLKGIAIGNGWIDPREQYPAYGDFAYEKGFIKPGTKEAEILNGAMTTCQYETDKWEDGSDMPINMQSCNGVMNAVTTPFTTDMNGKAVCMNIYDTRLVDDWPACGMNWPPDLPDLYKYLRQDAVLDALHATGSETAWVECSGPVGTELYLRNSPASINLFPNILESGVEVLLFAGDEDLICNYVGIERTIARLKWSGEQGFSNATAEQWTINGTHAGTWQKARGMTYVRVAGGSHMVGFDLPDVTNDMIMRFIGVDTSEIPGNAASVPSKVGIDERPVVGVVDDASRVSSSLSSGSRGLISTTSAMYFFAILFVLSAAVAIRYFLRSRSQFRLSRLQYGGGRREREDEEERVPLGPESHELGDYAKGQIGGLGKGKGRMADREDQRQVVFDIGDDD